MDAQCWQRRRGSSILRTGFGIPSQSSDLGSGKLSQSHPEWDFSGKAGWVEGDMVEGGCRFREMASLINYRSSFFQMSGWRFLTTVVVPFLGQHTGKFPWTLPFIAGHPG